MTMIVATTAPANITGWNKESGFVKVTLLDDASALSIWLVSPENALALAVMT